MQSVAQFGLPAVMGALAPGLVLVAATTWTVADQARFLAAFWSTVVAVCVGLLVVGFVALVAASFSMVDVVDRRDPDLARLAGVSTMLSAWAIGVLQAAVAAWRSASRRRRVAGRAPFALAPTGLRIAVGGAWLLFASATVSIFVALEVGMVRSGVTFGFTGELDPVEPTEPVLVHGLWFLVPAGVVPVVHLILAAVQLQHARSRRHRRSALFEVTTDAASS